MVLNRTLSLNKEGYHSPEGLKILTNSSTELTFKTRYFLRKLIAAADWQFFRNAFRKAWHFHLHLSWKPIICHWNKFVSATSARCWTASIQDETLTGITTIMSRQTEQPGVLYLFSRNSIFCISSSSQFSLMSAWHVIGSSRHRHLWTPTFPTFHFTTTSRLHVHCHSYTDCC